MNRAERRRKQKSTEKKVRFTKPPRSTVRSTSESPEALEQVSFLEHVHRDVDIEQHKEILFAGAYIGELEFLPLYRACMAASVTPDTRWKGFRRAQRALTLARYFDHALTLDGPKVECGVFKGFSSLLLSIVAKMHDRSFDGTGYHIVDSFAGLSEPTENDAIGTEQLQTGEEQPMFANQAGHFSVPLEHIKSVLIDFPNTSIHKGWIPEVFSDLPETSWSFVHVDVDLYEPTKDCLEYFLPRMVPGGIIINDDFGSPLFPGGGMGWKEIMEDKGLSYTVLDTGQAVFIKP